MRVHLVNPSDNSFGTAVITPRWLFVLAAATPESAGEPILVDESLEQINLDSIHDGDVVGVSVHTGNALRGYEVGRAAAERGAWVVYGGIHATLYPEEPFQLGAADCVVKGDGDHDLGQGGTRLCSRNSGPSLRRRQDCGRPISRRPLGPDAGGQVYVGLRANRPRMPQALLFLLGVAHRRPEAPPAAFPEQSSTKSSISAAAAFASSRSRTTISIRSL